MRKDLRKWLQKVDKLGELKSIKGADCNLEMSAISEIISGKAAGTIPALLFDEIPGYPKGFRTLFNILGSPKRVALTLGLPEKETGFMNLLHQWRTKVTKMKYIPPKYTKSAEFQSNVDIGKDVDLLKFPVPKFHELDGGRYLGTCHSVIQRDPDSNWFNVGTYRCMLVDHNKLALHVVEGQHGNLIMNQKYFQRGQKMPVAIAVGTEPTLWFSSFTKLPWGVSEFEYTGGIHGEPVEVVKGEFTGLPLPTSAEIVIEGECSPNEVVNEGPFGEWHGYYANLGLIAVPEPLVKVKAVYYRDNPILTCHVPSRPSLDTNGLAAAITNSTNIWQRLEDAGIPGVKGVWCHSQIAGDGLLIVVAIEQLFAGHSREAALVASQFPHVGRYTVIVEDDIDPSDIDQVIWAITTRNKPDQAIQILNRCRSNATDPTISIEEKSKYKTKPKPLYNSRAIIDACRPLEGKEQWYPISRISEELKAKVFKKWGHIIDENI